jgi:hypothetical protein
VILFGFRWHSFLGCIEELCVPFSGSELIDFVGYFSVVVLEIHIVGVKVLVKLIRCLMFHDILEMLVVSYFFVEGTSDLVLNYPMALVVLPYCKQLSNRLSLFLAKMACLTTNNDK